MFITKKKERKIIFGFYGSENIFFENSLNKYDEKKKRKVIEIFGFFLREQKNLILVKTIKKLMNKFNYLSLNNIYYE